MTQEELNDYNKLNRNQRKIYDFYQDLHPEWNHTQIMTMVMVGGIDPPPIPPGRGFIEQIREMFKKAAEYMAREVPRIFEKVKHGFATIISRLQNAVTTTWDKVIRWISELF